MSVLLNNSAPVDEINLHWIIQMAEPAIKVNADKAGVSYGQFREALRHRVLSFMRSTGQISWNDTDESGSLIDGGRNIFDEDCGHVLCVVKWWGTFQVASWLGAEIQALVYHMRLATKE